MLIIRMTLGPKLNNIGFYNLFHKANFISLDIKLLVNHNPYIEDDAKIGIKCFYFIDLPGRPKNCK